MCLVKNLDWNRVILKYGNMKSFFRIQTRERPKIVKQGIHEILKQGGVEKINEYIIGKRYKIR